jgi:N-acetylmuramoyl-L-alanine amidase-like protein
MVITLLAALAFTDTTATLPPGKLTPVRAASVWLVQTTPQFDLYSNGLRIEEQYITFTEPRRYLAFARAHTDPIASAGEWRSVPAGIVYHTTESHWTPFEESQNRSLQRAGLGLLEYVSRRHSYHFVIDRFGRIFRIVRESDYANHAGNSVWADEIWIYINLNQSFFGVAFEARSQASPDEPAVNAAQVYAGRVLTDMLRSRYGIPVSNCVAHAQVSVNPANYGVGYHQDWAANLPFAELGLGDNYKLALPSVELFGFKADALKVEAGPASMAAGLDAATTEVRNDAAAQNLPVGRYRGKLQKRYRDAIRALRGKGAYQEYN